MFGTIIVIFMAVGFALCALEAHCVKERQRRAAEAAAAAERQREREAVAKKIAKQAAALELAEIHEREQEAREARKRAAQEEADARQAARRAARLAAARELAEIHERERAAKLAAARELAEIKGRPAPQRRAAVSVDESRESALDRAGEDGAQPAAAVTLAQFAAAHAKPAPDAPKPFAGQVVAFTGRLAGMTRQEAIDRVIRAGGKAYKTMPAGTTLLVVGDNPGMCKMDKADEWIGQVRKITQAQFLAMFAS